MKELLKDISIYTFGNFLSKGFSFLAIVLYTRFLTTSEIGLYGYITVIIGFISTFMMIGLDNAYARYFFEFKNFEERRVLTSTVLFFSFFWSLIIVLISLLILSFVDSHFFLKNKDYKTTFLAGILGLPLRQVSILCDQVFRNNFDAKKYAVFNILGTIFNILFSLFFILIYNLKAVSIFLGILLSDILLFPFRLFFIRKMLSFSFDFEILKKLIHYGAPFVPTSFAYWIFSSTDRIILERLVDIKSVGIYTVALSFSNVMNLVAQAIGQAWSPHAVNEFEKNISTAKVLYIRFLKLLMFFSGILIFSFALFGSEIIEILFPQDYVHSFYPALFLMIGISFYMTTQVTALGISLAKKTALFIYITWFVALLNVFLNFVFVPFLKETGASLATSLSYLTLTIIYGIVSHRYLNLHYRFKEISLFFLILILSVIFSFLPSPLRISLFLLTLLLFFLKKNIILEFLKR